MFISLAAAFLSLASVSAADTTTTTTVSPDGVTTTRETVTTTGTLHQYVPGSSFVIQETAGPVAYSYGPDVVYATRSGAVLTPEQVQARIRVGVPVSVDYVPQGDTRVIRRVVVDDVEDLDDDDVDD